MYFNDKLPCVYESLDWVAYLSDSQCENLEREVNQEVDSLLDDADFREEIIEDHHDWCLEHHHEENSYLLPISALGRIAKDAPRAQFHIEKGAESFYVVKRHDKEGLFWDFYSDESGEFSLKEDKDGIREIMEQMRDTPSSIYPILAEYRDLAEGRRSAVEDTWASDVRILCADTPYAC